MSYLKKQDAISSIKTRVLNYHGNQYTIYEAYLGTDPYSKNPIRKAAKTESKLRKKLDDFYKKLAFGGDSAVLLTAYESTDARKALDLLKANGKDITLTECVRMILNDSIGTFKPCSITLDEAYEKYCTAQEGKSHDHIMAVKSRVGKWVSVFGGSRLLTDVTAKLVNDDLESRLYDAARTETKTTFNNHLGYIKTFMAWCADPEQAFIKTNPLESMKAKSKEWKQPGYASTECVSKMFRFLWEHRADRSTDLADAILSFFCGMRQKEIARVREGANAVTINLDEKFIRIVKCKGYLKGIKPRAFTIPDTALAWMRSFDFLESVKRPNRKFREHMVDVAKDVKVALPKNAGRHTFITMFSAAFKDQATLTKIAGNSEDVRSNSYDGLVSEKEGREYFAILPPV